MVLCALVLDIFLRIGNLPEKAVLSVLPRRLSIPAIGFDALGHKLQALGYLRVVSQDVGGFNQPTLPQIVANKNLCFMQFLAIFPVWPSASPYKLFK